ncbi:phage baseplate protein [Pectobacterium carotovorum]|uniref:Dit-like phage tail protein N-terminal domain-containing protein n=1 Tax=Pectobacterium odoriferum TaxID=78398 RepID=A0ABR4VI82_9GAMM|nr:MULTISPECIES: hypothetical protein [Pectobacterium]KGA39091.1 hypothetical protein KU75_24675 [Pectobacterium odoriferum]
MSIVGIFNKSRPQIRGIFFDAILEESSELRTDISEYPLETGATANDNAVTRPMTVTMTVAISDNPVKALMAQAGQLSTLGGIGAGVAAGAVGSLLGGGTAALAGVAASIGLSVTASGNKRSQEALDGIRWSQRNNEILTIIDSAGASYDNMIITNTRTQRNKENEGGLELVVEMRQLVLINANRSPEAINANLPQNDTATTQGQANVHLGEVTPQ